MDSFNQLQNAKENTVVAASSYTPYIQKYFEEEERDKASQIRDTSTKCVSANGASQGEREGGKDNEIIELGNK